ncbi:MAG: L,D-transpeptidase family protein [Actinomycetia bacterium]|nr:L,D-transpeptidase family protein [Actinomycetes bacterium]
MAAIISAMALLGAACSTASSSTDDADGSTTTTGSSESTASTTTTDSSGSTGDTAAPSQETTTTVTNEPEVTTSTIVDGLVLTDPILGPEPVILAPSGPGDRGDDVKSLQVRLSAFGFAPGTPDGSYGHKTGVAVQAFQGLMGLDETGIADTETVATLLAYRYDGLVLHAGDEGEAVESLQKRLASGPFNPGPIDGEYGSATITAVWALEKLAGVPVDGDWGPLDEMAWEQLTDNQIGHPEKDHDQRWVEFDLSDQLVKVYDPGSTVPVLISHASSGSGVPWANEDHSGSSITPTGSFHINGRISGWRESSLNIGRLYNPLYFNGGIAFHGATSVPLYPASHGCVRLPMHIAEEMPSELPNGTPVHVLP